MNDNIKQSVIFIALVLGLSYLVFWGPIAILQLKTANLVEGRIYNLTAFILFLIGGFVPSIIGLILTSVYDGKKGLKKLLISAINFKIGFKVLIAILAYTLLLGILQLILYTSLGGIFDYSQFVKQLPTILPLIILGPISEEFGWRGFLQKKLSSKYSPILVSIIVGIVWSLWHLPLFYMLGTSQHDFHIPFLQFMLSITSSSFVYTYVYNKSKGSLFTAILLHWIVTYILQVIASQVSRTATYDFLECVPAVILGCTFIIIMALEKKGNTKT